MLPPPAIALVIDEVNFEEDLDALDYLYTQSLRSRPSMRKEPLAIYSMIYSSANSKHACPKTKEIQPTVCSPSPIKKNTCDRRKALFPDAPISKHP